MLIEKIMRKLGYVSEKKLIDFAMDVFFSNDSEKARNESEFYYACGNANAVNYILHRFGINHIEIVKERREG